MKPFNIFISSVQSEFKKERAALKEFIEKDKLLSMYFEVFIFEDLHAKSEASEKVYLKEVSKSDIFILILGKDYGNIGSDGTSAIEREFSKAVEKKLCILTYVKNGDSTERDEKVTNLINRIKDPKSGFVFKSFKDIQDLKDEVNSSLLEFLTEKDLVINSPFDTAICKDATYNDINEELVIDFLKNRAIKRKVDIPKISVKDFLLKTLKVVKEEDSLLKPTNAAILFFSDNPQDFISQSSIKMARFRGNTRIEFIDSREIFGPFYKMIDEFEVFFKRNTRLASKIVEFKRVDIPEYPIEAIREAVINALAHRSYYRAGANVQIDIFDNRIEVRSPGGLLPRLDIKNLEGTHETRNRKICEIFHETADMEKFGTGIGKMKTKMVNHGLKPPEFSEPGNFFLVTFYGPGDKILDLVPDIPEERQIDLRKLGLNERQIEALRMMVNEGKVMTNSIYQQIFNVSRRTSLRDLSKLVECGQARAVGTGKGAKYEAL
ncbi:MAG: ATP-binding protein [Caldisericaceae bacterium]